MVVAAGGKACIYGGFSRYVTNQLSCLDGTNSTISWQVSDKRAVTALLAASDGIYVGYSGFPEVDKYEIPSGNVIWSQSLSGGGLTHIFMVNDEVQVSTNPFIFTILSKNDGKIIETKKGRGQDIYISTQRDTILPEIQAIDTSTGEILWQQFDLHRELRMAPIFLEDRIIVRTGLKMGVIYAIDRATGDILWETADNIVSSISYSPNKAKVYALTRVGHLLELDVKDGTQIILVEFSSTPFVLNGEKQVGGYEVALDDSTQMLFVLLGDSRQLFAFKVE